MTRPQAPRLLIVEDSASDRQIYRQTLRDFDLQFADSGEAGLERLGREPFDGVILDFDLPGLDGAQVLSRIRAELALDLPVILVTGGGQDLAADHPGLGAQGYVTKDHLSSPRVALAVSQAIERHRLGLATGPE